MLAVGSALDTSSPAMSGPANIRRAMAIEQPVHAFFTISAPPALPGFPPPDKTFTTVTVRIG
jgi:hypothetical protein